MKNIIFISLVITIISACDKVPEPAADNYVVEAYIFTGEAIKEVTIKTLVPLSDPEGDSKIIENASVILSKDSNTYPLAFNPVTKKYEYNDTDLEIQPNDVFEIEIEVNGRVANAITIVPTLPENIAISKRQMVIPEIKSGADFITGDPLADAQLDVSWSNPDEELFYTVIEFRGLLLDPILPPDVQEVVDDILENFAIITAPDTDSLLSVSGALLPSYGKYVVKVYKVNQEYADLYKSDTQDSRDLNEPPSNIINARGIFSAFASDSVFFEVVYP